MSPQVEAQNHRGVEVAAKRETGSLDGPNQKRRGGRGMILEQGTIIQGHARESTVIHPHEAAVGPGRGVTRMIATGSIIEGAHIEIRGVTSITIETVLGAVQDRTNE